MSSTLASNKITNQHYQLAQVQQLGLLNENIDTIINNYLPNRDSDSAKQIAKLTAENAALSNELIENFKPSISDQIKVGFYSTDRFTQTDESDIISLKAATETLDYLCNELVSVKDDLKFSKQSIKHQFEFELSNKTLEIYSKMTAKFMQLQKQQDESLNRIRQAYRSQLANALARVGQFAQEQSTFAVKQAKAKEDSKRDDVTNKFIQYQKTILDLQATIEDLKSQLSNNNENARNEQEMLMNQLKEEKQRSMDEIMMLRKKLGRLEEAVAIKEEETEKLLSEIANVQLQVEKEKMVNEQLTRDIKEVKAKNESEQQKLKKEFDKQKVQIESKMTEKLKDSRNQLMQVAKQEMQQKEAEAARKKKELEEQQKALKEQLSLAEALKQQKEKEVEAVSNLSKKEDLDLIAKLRRNEMYLKADIQRLKRELQRNDENWEKKFDILKKSLHAIKDEMYLRQNLQKQSANLAYASVAYTIDDPNDQFGMNETNMPRSTQSQPKPGKPVLPSINPNKGGLDRQLSFTISVPSRLSGHIDVDEAQIVGDDEMNRIKDEVMNDMEFIKVPMTPEM